MRRIFICCATLALLTTMSAQAQATPVNVCPAGGVAPRPATFEPSGIILTTFDNQAIWVYGIDGDRRYPLPETVPCTRNCSVSPDSQWLVRMSADFNFIKMRLDGTQRTVLAGGASSIEWWNAETFVVWTPDHRAYLLADGVPNTEEQRAYLDVQGVVVLQPGGSYALTVRQTDDSLFLRELEDLALRGLVGIAGAAPIVLGEDVPYFNDAVWSPDGSWLAFVRQVGDGAELYGVRPGDTDPTRWTDLTASYGPVRINGRALGDLSWSPDSTRVAFWATPLTGPNPEDAGDAQIHVYNLANGVLSAYCNFTTTEHTPNPPRLVWSPDGTHIAFGGNVPADDKGYLLLALNVAEGTFTELSDGIYPALGAADVIAWGAR